MSTVGFEPTPFRTSALSWRLRPLGQIDDPSLSRVDGFQSFIGGYNLVDLVRSAPNIVAPIKMSKQLIKFKVE